MAEVTRVTQGGLGVIGLGAPGLRVTSSGFVIVATPSEGIPQRITQAGLNVVGVTVASYAPTVTLTPLAGALAIETSTFRASALTPTDTHGETTYQVTAVTDPTFAAPFFNESFTAPDARLVFLLLDGLAGLTTFLVRALHTGLVGGNSAWSEVVSAETLDDTVRPDTPTATVLGFGQDYVSAESSVFSHTDGTTTQELFDPENPLPYLQAVQWQIRETVSTDIVFDSGLMPPAFLPAALWWEDLDPATAYGVRILHFDGYHQATSAWSAWATFTTLTVPVSAPDAPALTVTACELSRTADVTAAAFNHPEPAATHKATRWRAKSAFSGTYSFVTSTPAELTAYTWEQLTPGDWTFDAAYQDDSNRWGLFGATDTCEVVETPPAPELNHSGSTRICADILISWAMPTTPVGPWYYEGQLSANDGATWTSLFSNLTQGNYSFLIATYPDGVYLFRVRARYQAVALWGDWAYLVLRVDRSCSKTTVYDLAEITDIATDMPDWEVIWDTVDPTWTPVDINGNAGGGYGILGGAGKLNVSRKSVLAFKELGQPTLFEAEVEFVLFGRECIWYPWRWTTFNEMRGGLAYAATGNETEGGRSGLINTISSGGRPWAIAPDGADDCPDGWCVNPCTCDTPCVCYSSPGVTRQIARLFPTKHIEYAISSGNGTLELWGFKATAGRWFLFDYQPTTPLGAKNRGLRVSTRHTAGAGCYWRHTKYILRQRVTRTVTGGIRIQGQVLGPGLDPKGGWTTDHEMTYAEAQAVGCGYVGLSTDIWKDSLTQDPGIIFTSFSITPVEYDDCLAPEEDEEEPEPSPISPIYSPCPPDMETADKTLFLGGTASPGAIFRFGGYEVAAPQQIVARIRPNSTAPEGYGGECLFKSLFVVVEHISDITIRIVPILNGEWLDQYAQEETFIGPGDRAAIKRYEMPLYRAFEDLVVEGGEGTVDRFKYGLRGTYFTFDMTITDLCGIGLQLPGVWLDYEVVRESQGTKVVYTEDLVRLPLFVPTGQTFMGTKGANRVLKAASGVTDDGFQVEARIVSNPVAPAGEAGECHFKRVTMVVTRWNANDMDLKLTPYLDGYPAPPITVHYKATTAPVTEPVEIDLTQYYRRLGADATERFRYGLRGAWFHAKVETGSGLQEWLKIGRAHV